MAEWRTPVFDRTMDDVKSVDRTSATYQKGALNVDDLNRIEDNYKHLMAKLKSDAIFIPHRLRNFTETVLEYVEKENSVLPDGYTQLEHIQSDGNQYIDTGVKPNQNTRVIIDIKLIDATADNYSLFGARTASLTNCFNAFVNKTNVVWQDDYGTTTSLNGGNLPLVTERFLYDKNKNVTTIRCSDGTEHTHTHQKQTFTTPYNIVLFSVNTAGTLHSKKTKAKLYSCKIYDNETLVRDFVPCKNSSGSVGLIDLVNNTFYANAGTGAFAAGAEVETESIFELVETTITYTDWQENNLPWLSEINRIRTNHNALARLFLVGLGFSEQKESNYLDYIEVNNWEKIALAGKTIFENMEKEYRYCGMEKSGGDRLL